MSGVVSVQKYIYVSVGENSNKFWQATLFDDGQVECRWGRVNEPGQAKMFSGGQAFIDRKVREKLGKGYVEFVDVSNGNAISAPVSGVRLANLATQQIEHDPFLSSLIGRLVRANKHNILGNTTLSFSDTTGMFSTPLGVVGPDKVAQARGLLSDIGDAISGVTRPDSWRMNGLVEGYMKIVPVDIGRRRLTVDEVFPNMGAVRRQNDILDSLDVSLQMLATGPAPVAQEKKVFDVSLTQADASTTSQIEGMFRRTRKTGHESHRLEVKSVMLVDLRSNRAGFESDGVRVGNIKKLWHGTRVSNLLSILRSGLTIPRSYTNGWAYGPGVYASDISTKALNYSYGYWDGGKRDTNCFMFLVDMAMGREYLDTGGMYGGTYPKPGYDSTFAKGGNGVINNEMIVYRPTQVRLDMLVEFEE